MDASPKDSSLRSVQDISDLDDRQLAKIISDLKNFKTRKPCLQILPLNWKSIVYTAVLIATKYWDDKYYWNIDVVERLKIFDI